MVEVRGTPAGLSSGQMLVHGGFDGASPAFEEALNLEPDYIAADAGSTDAGPAFLGREKGMTHRSGIKQSLDYLLTLALRHKIPFLVGSAGMAGTRAGLEFFREITAEIARERGLHFTAAFIDSEQDKRYLSQRLRQGKIRPLGTLPPLRQENIDQATHIVGMMGTEPFAKALDSGAQVIIAGRACDSALFAAVPVMKGVPLAQAWHMAMVIDHGSNNVVPVPGVTTSVLGTATDDHFTVEATNPEGKCSAQRVAQATMYEANDPYRFYYPPGMLDISQAQFENVTPRVVKVTGSSFEPLKYTVRLEGATRVGYRTINIAGVEDPLLISILDDYLLTCERHSLEHAKIQGIDPSTFRLSFRVYGKNALLRVHEQSEGQSPREVCIIGDCVAETQEIASAVMNITHAQLLHCDYPGRLTTAGNVAFPYSPCDIECGPVYRFSVFHLLEPDDPLECCHIEMVDF